MKQRRSAKSSGSGSSSGGSKCGRNSGRVYASPEPSLQETTFHGLNHAVSGASACTRRVLWILLILVAVAGLVSVFVEKAVLFSTSPTATAFGIETKAIQPFPAVTVCNQNPFVASKLTGTRLAPLLANKPPQRFNRSAVAAAGHDASTMVFLCQLGPFECDPDELYTYVDPSFGLCFTFNSGAKDFTLYGANGANVSIAAGEQLPINTPGLKNGLVMEFYLQQSDSIPFTGTDVACSAPASAGVRYFVHDQGIWPVMESQSDGAPPGTATMVRVARRETRMLAPPWGNCVQDWLENGDPPGYSLLGCIVACQGAEVIAECECYPGLAWTEEIEAKYPSCLTSRELLECELTVAAAVSTSSGLRKDCGCNERCVTVDYVPAVSMLQFPSEVARTTELAKLNKQEQAAATAGGYPFVPLTTQTMIDNVARLQVYLGDLTTEHRNMTKSYTFTSLLSDVGGQMGLFAGISLLTLAELLEVCARYVCLKRRAKRKQGGSGGGSGGGDDDRYGVDNDNVVRVSLSSTGQGGGQ